MHTDVDFRIGKSTNRTKGIDYGKHAPSKNYTITRRKLYLRVHARYEGIYVFNQPIGWSVWERRGNATSNSKNHCRNGFWQYTVADQCAWCITALPAIRKALTAIFNDRSLRRSTVCAHTKCFDDLKIERL